MRIRYIIPTTIVILGRNMSRDQAFTKTKHRIMSRDMSNVVVTIGIM